MYSRFNGFKEKKLSNGSEEPRGVGERKMLSRNKTESYSFLNTKQHTLEQLSDFKASSFFKNSLHIIAHEQNSERKIPTCQSSQLLRWSGRKFSSALFSALADSPLYA